MNRDYLVRAIASACEAARKEEREACAKVADRCADTLNGPYTDLPSDRCDERAYASRDIAAAIRARSGSEVTL